MLQPDELVHLSGYFSKHELFWFMIYRGKQVQEFSLKFQILFRFQISDFRFQISDFRFQILVVSKLLSSTVVFCFQALNETGKHPGAKLRPRGTTIIENFEFSWTRTSEREILWRFMLSKIQTSFLPGFSVSIVLLIANCLLLTFYLLLSCTDFSYTEGRGEG